MCKHLESVSYIAVIKLCQHYKSELTLISANHVIYDQSDVRKSITQLYFNAHFILFKQLTALCCLFLASLTFVNSTKTFRTRL